MTLNRLDRRYFSIPHTSFVLLYTLHTHSTLRPACFAYELLKWASKHIMCVLRIYACAVISISRAECGETRNGRESSHQPKAVGCSIESHDKYWPEYRNWIFVLRSHSILALLVCYSRANIGRKRTKHRHQRRIAILLYSPCDGYSHIDGCYIQSIHKRCWYTNHSILVIQLQRVNTSICWFFIFRCLTYNPLCPFIYPSIHP